MRLLLTLAFSLTCLASAQQNARLATAEKARGVMSGDQGLQWTVDVNSSASSGATKTARFRAKAQSGNVFAEILAPEQSAGKTYLAESDGKMWFFKPGLSRPVSVSKRQRLSGDAAIGDLASTSYVTGYSIASEEPGSLDGRAATLFTMKSNSLGDVYHTIRYWIADDTSLGLKAEFLSKSGTLLRTATFDYQNTLSGSPFLSQMIVTERDRTVTLDFSEVSARSFPSSQFTREALGGGRVDRPGKR